MNINTTNIINCTGCSACYSKCPYNAIDMKYDNEGFIYPYVDASKCTDCNLCIKICPALHLNNKNTGLQECYAVMGKDEIRRHSSSGGVFSIIAEYIFRHNGYVCGAAFNDEMQLMHMIINKREDLDKLRRSKYLESKIGDIFTQIKALLKHDEYVLFCGTPCQVAGLYAYLGCDYDKLITLDLVCGGVPSQKVFDKYLSEIFPNTKISDYSFRDKSCGWKVSGKIVTQEGEERFIDFDNDLYFKLFVPYHMSIRTVCSRCDYANLQRVGDITIGDFWGIKEKRPDLYDNLGTSLVIVNTIKGKNILNEMKEFMIKCEQVPIEYSFNNTVLQPCRLHPLRDKFFRDFDKMSLVANYNDKTDIRNSIGIFNCFNTNMNFGALLTAFALLYFLSNANNGKYVVQNLKFKTNLVKDESIKLQQENPNFFKNGINPHFEQFRNKYMSATNERMHMRGLPYFNSQFTHFIVGLDQMFNGDLISEFFASLLQFVQNDKNIISCAASFGGYELNDNELRKMYASSLKRFDLLSLREKSGVEQCKSLGIHNVKHFIDPVFYIDKNVYKNIADTSINKKKYNTVCYSVGDNFWNGIIEYIQNGKGKHNKELHDIYRIDYHISVEDWLYAIMNCNLFITNSFHGVCFALIFEKNFISINGQESSDRVISLLEDLNINGHKFYSIKDIDFDLINQNPIDYTVVNNKLSQMAQYAKDTLLSSIETFKIDNNKVKEKSFYLHELYDFYKQHYDSVLEKIKQLPDNEQNKIKEKMQNDLLDYDTFLTFINKN